ncbi:MAG: flagellar biosynthesis protein FlhF, partial [Azonexus sp.]|nr:flagellar biosynthesis protein FlhF [Azonexus sp.]
MNVRKFIAANPRDALRKVKETLGNDAIILSNRGIPGGVEIMAVAARDMAMIAPTTVDMPAAQAGRPPQPPAAADDEDDYRLSLSTARAQVAAGRHAIPGLQIATAPSPAAQPAPRPAAMVNASIPRTGALRNLEAARPQPAPLTSSPAPSPAAPQSRPAAAPAAETPRRAAAEVVPMEVMEEIRSLRKMVEQHLAGFAWGESARAAPIKTEVLRQML